MPGDNLYRCYPPRRIGKSLLNDQRLGKLYSFLHFSTRYTLQPPGNLAYRPPFRFFPSPGCISRDPKSNVSFYSRFFSSFLSLRSVYQVFTHEFLFFLSNANYYIDFICYSSNKFDRDTLTNKPLHAPDNCPDRAHSFSFIYSPDGGASSLGNLSSSNGNSINVLVPRGQRATCQNSLILSLSLSLLFFPSTIRSRHE